MRRGVLFTGIAVGTCLVVLAYMDGARPAVPGVPHLIGVPLAAVLVWLVMAAVVTWLAELLRRHHRTLAAHAGRQGKRGTIAAARMAGKGGRSAGSRLASWAGPRWAERQPVSGGDGRPTVPPPGLAPGRTRSWWQLAGGHDVVAEPGLSDAQRERDANGQENVCAACGHQGTPGDPLVIAGGYRVHTSETTDPASGFHNPASAPAPAATQGGNMRPSDKEEWKFILPNSRITPDRRAHRAATSSGGKVPSEWGPVVATAADFEPESDADLLAWMDDQTAGEAAWAEALIEVYEHGTSVIGISPAALAALHDVADAAAHCAEIMNAAKGTFKEYFELPREFAANGGVMTHDGRFITGEGD